MENVGWVRRETSSSKLHWGGRSTRRNAGEKLLDMGEKSRVQKREKEKRWKGTSAIDGVDDVFCEK